MAVSLRYARPGLPTEADFDAMTSYLKRIVGNEKVLTFYVDHGGYKISQPFERALRNNNVHWKSYVMKQGRLRKGDEPLSDLELRAITEIVSKLGMKVNPERYVPKYRPILGIVEDPKREDSPIYPVSELGKQDTAFALTVDDDNHRGFSAVGNAIGTLIHRGTLGFERYLQAVEDDRLGVSHLSRDGLGNPRSLRELIEFLAPKEYLEMRRKGLIDAIYDSEFFYEEQQRQPRVQKLLKSFRYKRRIRSMLAEIEKHSSWLV